MNRTKLVADFGHSASTPGTEPPDGLLTLNGRADIVELVAVNVGQPRTIGRSRFGQPIVSGIVKERVDADVLYLDSLNLAGDRQADLRVHGGPDKAVYAYPSEHLSRWNAELAPDPPFGLGTFGENLSTRGWLEDAVRIGDVWSWGEALLQVSQPRSPCYKLATVTRRPAIGKRMVANGRTGWYLRVLRPGTVPVTGPIAVVERHPAAVSVLDAHRALLIGGSVGELEQVVAVDALAESWRQAVIADLDRLDAVE